MGSARSFSTICLAISPPGPPFDHSVFLAQFSLNHHKIQPTVSSSICGHIPCIILIETMVCSEMKNSMLVTRLSDSRLLCRSLQCYKMASGITLSAHVAFSSESKMVHKMRRPTCQFPIGRYDVHVYTSSSFPNCRQYFRPWAYRLTFHIV
jgi:hypothetical protein